MKKYKCQRIWTCFFSCWINRSSAPKFSGNVIRLYMKVCIEWWELSNLILENKSYIFLFWGEKTVMFKKCLGPVCDGRSSCSRVGSSFALARERRLWTARDDWNIHGRTCKLLYFLFSNFCFNFSFDHLAYRNNLFYSVPLRSTLK